MNAPGYRSSSLGGSSPSRELFSDEIYRKRVTEMKRTLRDMGSNPTKNEHRAARQQPGAKQHGGGGTAARKVRRMVSNPRNGLGRATRLSESSKSPSIGPKDDTQPSIACSRDEGDRISEDSLQMSGRRARNVKHSKKTRQGFLRTFAKLGKFVCILIGLWRKHANRVREFLDNVDMVSVDEISDLLFDKTDYSADKRVEIALRNYPSIAAYPVSIQNLIARKAWYELYAGKRIIIKQGHVARCFYFILSGKVIISRQEEDSHTSRTLCYLNKGDSFGEVALINKSHRTASVISDGTVELLVVTDEDYEEIFTSGGLTEKYFPFLKRKTVICENTSTTPWIYVIKSGSVTVLKKLKEPKEQEEREEENKRRLRLQQLSSEDHYRRLCEVIQKSNKLNRKESMIRHLKLKELALGVTMTPVLTSASSTGEKMDAIDEVSAVNTLPKIQPITNTVDTVEKRRHMTTWQMGPMVTRTGMTSSLFNEGVTSSVADSDQRSQSESPQLNTSRRVSFDIAQEVDKETKPGREVFVTVQTLVKGDVFGLAELIHGKQPTFVLVSNGAECIMIDKRLYWEKATDCQKLMRKLKDEVLSYPTDEKMQSDLMVALSWEKYKQKTFHKALRRARLEKKLNQLPLIRLSVN